jgi:SAM-dependent methyltransferase
MDYKEFDFEGEETLKTISEASAFNQWMYETIKPYCKGKILEIGSGIGTISDFFINDGSDIILSDIRDQYRTFLNSRYKEKSIGIRNINIVADDFRQLTSDLSSSLDTVFALNVVEHIQDDQLAVKNMLTLLKPGGRLIILVPAFQLLYNNFDRELMHYRRYTRKSLNNLFLNNSDVSLKKSFYFNSLGIAGWFVAGSILQKKMIPSGNMRFFNKLVPFARIMDRVTHRFAGLSVVAVVQKRE